jgi:hypothetical protein
VIPTASSEPVTSLAYDNTGHLLIVGRGTTVELYDESTDHQLGPSLAATLLHGGTVQQGPDGEIVLGTVRGARIIDTAALRLAAIACQQAGRELTDREWGTYLASTTPYRSTCAELASQLDS